MQRSSLRCGSYAKKSHLMRVFYWYKINDEKNILNYLSKQSNLSNLTKFPNQKCSTRKAKLILQNEWTPISSRMQRGMCN